MTCKQKNTSIKTEPKKIIIIWQADYPWDVRIEKQINVFSAKGWETHIICRNLSDKPVYENQKKLHIHRFKNFLKNTKLLNLLSFPMYINPFWSSHVENKVKEINPDVIMVRDIPLAPLALKIGKKHKIPVVADIAEHYPAMIKELPERYGKNPISRFLLYKLKWFDFIEKITVKNSDFVFVVVQEQKERFVRSYGVNPDKIGVVSNTPCIQPEEPISKEKKLDDTLKIIYTCKLEAKFRGIETVIETAANLTDAPVEFIIAGDGEARQELEQKSRDLGLDNVRFLGDIEHGRLYDLIREADIGVIAHLKSDLTDYTLPNKLFDYMACALPVISTDINPVKRIIKEENCGWIYNSGDAESLKNLVLDVLKDKNCLSGKGNNGFNAVKNKYNFSKDSKILIETLMKLT